MATETIFLPIKIDTPDKIERFALALEAAEADPILREDVSNLFRTPTKEEIKEMFKNV
jgi:hypothetical protein